MIFKDKYFPYPVLKSVKDDFTNSTFNIKEINNVDENYYIEIFLNNNDVLELIKTNKASLVLHLEESDTMYRKVHKFNKLSYNFKIPHDKVRRKIELSLFIVMDEDVSYFKSKDLHLIYDGINIKYEKHNIIGYSDSVIIDINKESDEIKNVRSIFSLISDKDIKDVYELDLRRETILIKMNEEDYKNYASLIKRFNMNRQDYHIILLTILIMPSFVETLNQISQYPDNYRDYNWFNSLISAFEKKDVDILDEFSKDTFNAYKYAQIIFDGVISESINQMKNIHLS